MTQIDKIQAVTAYGALFLQIAATCLACPLRAITPLKVWTTLILLNFSIMSVRFLSVLNISGWQNEMYQGVRVTLGMIVSVFMLATVILLRRHVMSENKRREELATKVAIERKNLRDMSVATVAMVQEVNCDHEYKLEDSPAYRLAQYYIKQQQQKKRSVDVPEVRL